MLQWECMAKFCPSFFRLLEAVVGWVSMLVDETSILVGLSVDVVNLIKFEFKLGNCGQVGYELRHG